MHYLKRVLFVALLLTMTQIGSHAQTPKVSDCIISANNVCRGLGIQQVSAMDSANAVTINAPNISEILDINGVCSAGTAALTVSASTDNTNYLTIDTIAAVSPQVKQYNQTTLGAGIALTPLGFQYVRVSMATCGAGNTSTLNVAMKGF